MRIPASGVDYFHHLLHRLIEDRGGPGNLAQLRLTWAQPFAQQEVARGLARLGAQAWLFGATWHDGWRGPSWRMRGPAHLALAQEPALTVDACGERALAQGLHAQRLAAIACAGGRGLVLTWDHRLLDARAMLGLLARLPAVAAGGAIAERWWVPGARRLPGVPSSWAERGAQARASLEQLAPHRQVRLWQPPAAFANTAVPLVRASLTLSAAETLRMDARAVAASGRFSETAYLLGCLSAALAELGADGECLFTLANDLRDRTRPMLLANGHSFLFVRSNLAQSRAELPQAARQLKEAQRKWLAGEMPMKMACALEFFPCIGERLARLQLGNFRGGLAASCLVGNVGTTVLPDPFFGAHLSDIGHATACPANPGLSCLFHRFAGRLRCDLTAAGRVAEALPPTRVLEGLRVQLLERPFPGATR